jgi:hypothetical protein
MPIDVSIIALGKLPKVGINNKIAASTIGNKLIILGNFLKSNDVRIVDPISFSDESEENSIFMLSSFGENGRCFPIIICVKKQTSEDDLFVKSL